jgi:hypothetical protein
MGVQILRANEINTVTGMGFRKNQIQIVAIQ